MKRIFSLILVLVLLLGISACTSEAEPVEDDSFTIGLSMNDMGNPFISFVAGGIEEAAKAEGNMTQLADAAGNVQNQISQIENFITMKVDAIFIFATDPVALADVVTRAHEAGIKIVTAGGNLDGADVVMNVDQFKWGEQSANLMVDWSKSVFTNTTGKVIVLKVTNTSEAAKRSNGIIDTLTNAGFDVVVAETEALTAADGRSVIENMWQQNSDAIGIVTYNADSASGANEFIMSLNNVDKAKFAIYSCDTSDAIQALINQSKDNSSVFRGTVGIGGPEIDGKVVGLPEGTYTIISRLIQGVDIGYAGDAVVSIIPQ